MAIEWSRHGKLSVLGIATGAVAGLVASTPAFGTVGPLGPLTIGFASSLCCFYAASSLKRATSCGDSLDVFGVHSVGGFVGAILTGVFTASACGGSGLDGGIEAPVGLQFVGAKATVIYSGGLTFVIVKVPNGVIGVRVSKDQ
jgi:Amt family ammonium transporter